MFEVEESLGLTQSRYNNNPDGWVPPWVQADSPFQKADLHGQKSDSSANKQAAGGTKTPPLPLLLSMEPSAVSKPFASSQNRSHRSSLSDSQLQFNPNLANPSPGSGTFASPLDLTSTPGAGPSKQNSLEDPPDETAGTNKMRRKRKKNDDANDDKRRRPKTGRACDACRTKKIRCDILPSNPSLGRYGQQICANCKSNEIECTFFLPITETRFKKKNTASDISIPDAVGEYSPSSVTKHQFLGHVPSYENMGDHRDNEGTSRVEGPTSISFLLHTSVPPIQNEAYDLRHHNSWEVLEDGNGLIRVNAPPTATGYADADPHDPTKAHNRLNRPVLSAQTMSLLVNAYFNDIAPLFPIISRTEFASKSNPSPLLLYSICGLGATRRQFPKELFTGVRGVINGLLRSNDMLSNARFENVQALLLLAQVGDLHAQPIAPTASAAFIRTGVAIRMAQDLGLHRELSRRTESAQDLAFIELRRRVWSTCVIMDRWYGAALGIPLMVDLLDCDVLLPASYEILPKAPPTSWPIEPSYIALSEHLKLSILMGRVLKTIYSPTGLKYTTDVELTKLLDDLNKWMDKLPEQLKFKGITSSPVSGLLHMGFAATQFLFWRVFLRLEYECPPHLQFRLVVSQWTKITVWAREVIQWLDANDDALDTVFIYPYAATSCALIQYHTWARRGEPEALESLKLIKETATRWESITQPVDQMSIRRKTCETMTLLYEAALKTSPSGRDTFAKPSGNPTAGVSARKEISKLVFVKDPSRPGGGIFVAQNEKEKMTSGLIQEDVMLASELHNTESQKQELGKHQEYAPHDPQDDIQAHLLQHPQQARTDDLGQVVDMQSGVLQNMQNVNPHLGSGELGQPETMPQFAASADNASSVLDSSFLDSLPLSTFDWESWSAYFDKFLPNANNNFDTMQ
nr:hypothetical protein L203_01936 [Cryptococcus depauperatus CBS 7841]